jgi:hypothetical protein
MYSDPRCFPACVSPRSFMQSNGRRSVMTQLSGQSVSNHSQVVAFTSAHSLLLVSSGTVRKCGKESMLVKFKKRMVKWGLSRV